MSKPVPLGRRGFCAQNVHIAPSSRHHRPCDEVCNRTPPPRAGSKAGSLLIGVRKCKSGARMIPSVLMCRVAARRKQCEPCATPLAALPLVPIGSHWIPPPAGPVLNGRGTAGGPALVNPGQGWPWTGMTAGRARWGHRGTPCHSSQNKVGPPATGGRGRGGRGGSIWGHRQASQARGESARAPGERGEASGERPEGRGGAGRGAPLDSKAFAGPAGQGRRTDSGLGLGPCCLVLPAAAASAAAQPSPPSSSLPGPGGPSRPMDWPYLASHGHRRAIWRALAAPSALAAPVAARVGSPPGAAVAL